MINKSKCNPAGHDDLPHTDKSLTEEKWKKIRNIPLSEIDDFPDHPFQVRQDEDMEQLVDSIRRNDILTPAIVRQKEDGRYELVSGHRRKFASALAGKDTLICEIKNLTRDQAIIEMVEGNLQRSEILPSEKAFAYRMRLEAMNRQGQRRDLTSDPLGPKLSGARSNQELSEQVSDSTTQIKRYIRLTYLIPEFLQMVDEHRMAFRPAVSLSYLSEEKQYMLLEIMQYQEATPSVAQAVKLKRFAQDGELTAEVMQSIMQEAKPNQCNKPVFQDERITKLIPKSIPRGQETDFVVKALAYYNKFLQRKKEQQR